MRLPYYSPAVNREFHLARVDAARAEGRRAGLLEAAAAAEEAADDVQWSNDADAEARLRMLSRHLRSKAEES